MTADLPRLRRYDELAGKTFVVCVGAMRSATSWLYTHLATLPGVTVSPLKELHFFSMKFPAYALNDMDALFLKRLAFMVDENAAAPTALAGEPVFRANVDRVQMIYDEDAYFGHFARLATPGMQAFCDITPAYAVLGADGFRYLKAFAASQGCRLRLVFVMRDPVERLWSQLRHLSHLSPKTVSLAAWEDAIASPRFRARADYMSTICDLDDVFDAEDVLYLFYEDLFAGAALERLSAFIGVGFRPGETATRRNVGTVKATMPAEVGAAFRDLLAPQYEFCRSRFGAAVPQSWGR